MKKINKNKGNKIARTVIVDELRRGCRLGAIDERLLRQ